MVVYSGASNHSGNTFYMFDSQQNCEKITDRTKVKINVFTLFERKSILSFCHLAHQTDKGFSWNVDYSFSRTFVFYFFPLLLFRIYFALPGAPAPHFSHLSGYVLSCLNFRQILSVANGSFNHKLRCQRRWQRRSAEYEWIFQKNINFYQEFFKLLVCFFVGVDGGEEFDITFKFSVC